ncbi:peptide ABC transporter ATP-binding protein [Vibrio cholerae]|nr:peptide ABC transporter ATP-binding protein [Vibrio cholerae]
MSLLEVKNLRIEYPSRHGVHAAVKSLTLDKDLWSFSASDA